VLAAGSGGFFSDACFIGHSMVVGMSNYFSRPDADYFGVNGISANRFLSYNQFTYRASNGSGGTTMRTGTIADALAARSYGKVYIMLGTNELGPESRHADVFYNSICSLIDIVRNAQPTAKIYLISVLPVSQSCSNSSSNFNRANVRTFNNRLMQAASEKGVFYIDAYSVFADSNGYLPSSACANDGIHILGREYARLRTVIETF